MQRAKRLIDESSLPMTEIAKRAGFGSLRRFNSAFAEIYGRPPTELRRARRSARKEDPTVENVVIGPPTPARPSTLAQRA